MLITLIISSFASLLSHQRDHHALAVTLVYFLHFLFADWRNTYTVVFGLAGLLAQCKPGVNSPVTSLRHVSDLPIQRCTCTVRVYTSGTACRVMPYAFPPDVSFRLADLNIVHTDSLDIRHHKPRRKRPHRRGRRKQARAIPVLVTQRRDHRPSRPLSVLDTSTCPQNTVRTRDSGNSISICTSPREKYMTVCCFNTHRDKRTEIGNFVHNENFDILFLTQTWLRWQGNV